MPGFTSTAAQREEAAEQVRVAELLLGAGDAREAAGILERTLERCAEQPDGVPGWLCGRLASLYHSLERYDDEVAVLERYRDARRGEEAQGLFDARLSEAREIVARRAAAGSLPRGRPQAAPAFTPDTIARLRAGFVRAARDAEREPLTDALRAMSEEAALAGHPPERLVVALKQAWRGTSRPVLASDTEWDDLYRDTLTRLLSLHFEGRTA